MDLLRICLGLGMVFTGAGVAVHAAYRIKIRHWEPCATAFRTAPGTLSSTARRDGQTQGKKSTGSEDAFFKPVQLNQTHRYEGIPLCKPGATNTTTWKTGPRSSPG